ncbi:MAG: NTP transferase domain-containing protein [Chlorobia bacterium]|nr:NTP transferase domain-containing protein [Fimbriimonadaceae bacterium]
MIAILPAAGKGTRMSGLTAGGSKELLPVSGRPVFGWAVAEAEEALVDRIVAISSPDKEDLNEFLQNQPTKIETAMQFVPDGLAPAIALAGSHDSALVILPDTLFYPKMPSVRIARALSEGFDIVVLTERVDESAVSSYGIVEADANGGILHLLEKPAPSATKSRNAVAGRYGLSERMMEFLSEALYSLSDENEEIALTPILNLAIKNDFHAIALAVSPDEQRFDCGSPEGYRAACEAIQ